MTAEGHETAGIKLVTFQIPDDVFDHLFILSFLTDWTLADKISCRGTTSGSYKRFNRFHTSGWQETFIRRSLRCCLTPPTPPKRIHLHPHPHTHTQINLKKQTQRKQNPRVLDTRGSTKYSRYPSINNPHLIIRRLTDIRCADDWRLETTEDDGRREGEQQRAP